MKYAGPLTAGALGLLAAVATITEISAKRRRDRKGAVLIEMVAETPDGFRFTQLLSPAAIQEVSAMVGVALDPWIDLVQTGEAQAFLMAQLNGIHHVAFIACTTRRGLVLDAAFGVDNTLATPAEIERIRLFLAANRAVMG